MVRVAGIILVPDWRRPRLHDDKVGRKRLVDDTQRVVRKRPMETRTSPIRNAYKSKRTGYRTRIHRYLARLQVPSFREYRGPQNFTSQTTGPVIPGIRSHRSRTERGFGVVPGSPKLHLPDYRSRHSGNSGSPKPNGERLWGRIARNPERLCH